MELSAGAATHLLTFVLIPGRLNLQDRKMQDWKLTDKSAGLENAGLELFNRDLLGASDCFQLANSTSYPQRDGK